MGLSAWCLHQRYLNKTGRMAFPALPPPFPAGHFGLQRVGQGRVPGYGFQFILTILMVGLVFWIALR
ncbi:DUF1422 family protein [Pantoea ananatis]